MGPAWSTGFAGADLALGASLDLRKFVANANRAALTFAMNPGSALIAGVLTLTSTGVLTRIGNGAIAGVSIDVASYGAGVNGGDTPIFSRMQYMPQLKGIVIAQAFDKPVYFVRTA